MRPCAWYSLSQVKAGEAKSDKFNLHRPERADRAFTLIYMGYPRRFFNRVKKRDNPEGRLVRQIITYLRIKGCKAGKIKTHGVYDVQARSYRLDPNAWVGVPDILAFTPQMVFIECKSSAGIQSSHQKEFERLCKIANINYILARSLSDIEKII